MTKKFFFKAASTIFTIVFVVHGLRVIYGWSFVFNGFAIPMWISYLAIVITGLLAYHGFKMSPVRK